MSGCVDHRGAGGFAEAVDDVDHASGEAGFQRQFRDAQGGQRRLLGGLHDHRVAARQGWTPLPRQHQKGEVPRNDLADDADRLPQRVATKTLPRTGTVLPSILSAQPP